jgi:hypothetical protein
MSQYCTIESPTNCQKDTLVGGKKRILADMGFKGLEHTNKFSERALNVPLFSHFLNNEMMEVSDLKV